MRIRLACLAVLALAGCRSAEIASATTLAANAATEWPVHGGTDLEQRYSPLADINQGNVSRLGLAWAYAFDTNRGQEATPIVVDGVVYVSSAWSKVFALDAATGRELWRFDPEVPGGKAVHACCDVVNRGVAVTDGRVFIGTIDGRLIALDARTGAELWSARTTDIAEPYTITGAPRVMKGLVVIGNGGAELGVRGYVTAYDAATGRQVWRFYTVPGDPAKGPDGAASDAVLQRLAQPTWSGEWWRYGGGGTVWDAIVYDPELNQLYLGVGNGSVWNHQVRSAGKGDNLFVGSIVALDPDTGRYLWHYQETPGDSWDYTSTQPIMLADLNIDGRPRKVLMHAPKNGFFYVIDRRDGRLVSARNYVPVNWASHIDMATGRPVETPGARYVDRPFDVYPAGIGGHSWHPMAFSPETGLVYIPAILSHMVYDGDPGFRFRHGRWNTATSFLAPGNGPRPEPAGARPADADPGTSGALIAWDPVRQREVWRHRYDQIWNGGALATGGGLVFQGTIDGRFQAFSAADGRLLWTSPAGTGVMAGPVSYRIGGVQYVAVVAGTGGAVPIASPGGPGRLLPNGRVLVYRLGGKAALPADDGGPLPPPNPPAGKFTAAEIEAGRRHYVANCSVCHGGYILPDLKRSAFLADRDAWRSIVIDGALESRGMASFRDYLSPADAEAIRAYVGTEARKLAKASEGAAR